MINMMTKKCNKCNVDKPYNDMIKSKANKNGIGSYCKECMKEKSILFRKNNIIQQMLSGTKSSAKKRNILFNLTIDDIVIPEKCIYLGILLTNEVGRGLLPSAATIDRIDNNKGYTRDNIQIISHKANKIKEALTIDEMIVFSKNILKIYKNK